MKRVFTDRSRIETYQRCPRSRFLGYHEGPDGLGIQSAKKPLPLVVGGSVHCGLEVLLRSGQALYDSLDKRDNPQLWRVVEDAAVDYALADFHLHADSLELDTMELAQQANKVTTLTDQLAESAFSELGLTEGDPLIQGLRQEAAAGAHEYDAYLAAEQGALVEGMLRAYARRRLRPLLEQFEVLEVEREGEWELSRWQTGEWVSISCVCGWGGVFDIAHPYPRNCPNDTEQSGGHYLTPSDAAFELYFMSRPDALLRDRQTSDLVIMSFKTAASWDVRKERDAQHDMQGLSEGVEIERRLGEWWAQLQDAERNGSAVKYGLPEPMVNFLRVLPAPPRILAIRYEYLLKHDRFKDNDLTQKFGFECRSQRSPLVRGYLNKGMTASDEQWCWSYKYRKEDGSESNLYYKNWRSTPVWEHMPILQWIDMLDAATETMSGEADSMGQDVRSLGFKCDAQATGYTAEHPLDSVFLPPITVFRQDDDLRDWIEQVEHQERAIAQHVEEVQATEGEDERRSLLNRHFPQNRKACCWPSLCAMEPICFGGQDMRRDPLSSGRYKVRQLNHPQEGLTNISHKDTVSE
jgi:hypothetical protein